MTFIIESHYPPLLNGDLEGFSKYLSLDPDSLIINLFTV